MTNTQLTQLSLAARRAKADAINYTITWRSNDASELFSGIAGFAQLCARLGLTQRSVTNYLSRGRGSFQRGGTNPLTGELDILTVTRHEPEPPPAKRRGRPPKALDLERLGTDFAPPARSMPKDRNRTTDEKR